jgi:hypothetical protein
MTGHGISQGRTTGAPGGACRPPGAGTRVWDGRHVPAAGRIGKGQRRRAAGGTSAKLRPAIWARGRSRLPRAGRKRPKGMRRWSALHPGRKGLFGGHLPARTRPVRRAACRVAPSLQGGLNHGKMAARAGPRAPCRVRAASAPLACDCRSPYPQPVVRSPCPQPFPPIKSPNQVPQSRPPTPQPWKSPP